ncbi:MAG: NAD(P)H-binding protein [Candidatus Dormibacteria bacterium]
MRVAITGGTGFVGVNTARTLLEAGHEVVLVARGTRRVKGRPGVSVVRADVIAGEGLTAAFEGCDAVVHLTAVIRERGRQTFDAVIGRGTENAVHAAQKAGIAHFIYVSAIGAGPDPRFPYFFAKWQAENTVAASGLPYSILRPSLIFGPGDGFFTLLRSLVRFSVPVVPVAGDGLSLFQPIAIGDVARCILLTLQGDPTRTATDIGGSEQLTYDEIIDTVGVAIGAGRRIKVHVPVPAILPAAYVMDRILPRPPVTPSQLKMLERHNITRIDAVEAAFGFVPLAFTQNAEYLAER